MRTRLAKKIMNTTFAFRSFDGNYQPYSIPQQRKAIKVLTRGNSEEVKQCLKDCVTDKVPNKYRKWRGLLPDEFEQFEEPTI